MVTGETRLIVCEGVVGILSISLTVLFSIISIVGLISGTLKKEDFG